MKKEKKKPTYAFHYPILKYKNVLFFFIEETKGKDIFLYFPDCSYISSNFKLLTVWCIASPEKESGVLV